MSRDVSVYTRRSDAIPVEDILAGMRARGAPLVQRPGPLTERPGTSEWRSRHFYPEGGTDPQGQIAVSTEIFKELFRRSILSSFSERVTPDQRAAIEAAQRAYDLSAPSSVAADDPRERVLAALVDTLAELGDGVIIDATTNRVYDRQAYRAAHAGHFNPPFAG